MVRLLAVISLICTVTACKKTPSDATIEQVWADRCATCHGDGDGHGEAAARLDPRPRNLRDPVWQSARDDATIGKTIIEGGASVGRSPLMPPHPDLDDRRAELVAYVRGLAGPATATTR